MTSEVAWDHDIFNCIAAGNLSDVTQAEIMFTAELLY